MNNLKFIYKVQYTIASLLYNYKIMNEKSFKELVFFR